MLGNDIKVFLMVMIPSMSCGTFVIRKYGNRLLGTTNENAGTEIPPYWNHIENAVAGVVAGIVGGGLVFPFEAAKKYTQQAIVVPWRSPRQLYVGVGNFSVCLGGISLIHTGVFHFLDQVLPKEEYGPLSAIGAGAVGGTFGASFLEAMLITQQRKQMQAKEAIRYMFRQGGVPRCLLGASMYCPREMIFVGAMLHYAEKSGRYFEEEWGKGHHRFIRLMLYYGGQFPVGLIAACLSQPFDSTATEFQRMALDYEKNPKSTVRPTLSRAFNSLVHSSPSGITELWRGGGYRCMLFTGGMVAIGETYRGISGALTNI